jgi:hypothetical protein
MRLVLVGFILGIHFSIGAKEHCLILTGFKVDSDLAKSQNRPRAYRDQKTLLQYNWFYRKFSSKCQVYNDGTKFKDQVRSIVRNKRNRNRRDQLHLIHLGHGITDRESREWQGSCDIGEYLLMSELKEMAQEALDKNFQVGISTLSCFSGNLLMDRKQWKGSSENYPCIIATSRPRVYAVGTTADETLLLRNYTASTRGRNYYDYWREAVKVGFVANPEVIAETIGEGSGANMLGASMISAIPFHQLRLAPIMEKIENYQEVGKDDINHLANYVAEEQILSCGSPQLDQLENLNSFYDTKEIEHTGRNSFSLLFHRFPFGNMKKALDETVKNQAHYEENIKCLNHLIENKTMYNILDHDICRTRSVAKRMCGQVFSYQYYLHHHEIQKDLIDICPMSEEEHLVYRRLFDRLIQSKRGRQIDEWDAARFILNTPTRQKQYPVYSAPKTCSIIGLGPDRHREEKGIFDLVYIDYMLRKIDGPVTHAEDKKWRRACDELDFPK